MNIHEYQAKELFAKYGIDAPEGRVAATPEEAEKAAGALGGVRWVVKAQIHAGARGKAGGVKIVSSVKDVYNVTKEMLGKNLVTHQTDAVGLPVNQVWVEKPSDIARELYLGAVIDRATKRVVFMASTEGGVEIEKVAEATPEKIIQVVIDPLVGLQPFQAREVAFDLGLEGDQIKHFVKIMVNMYKMFVDNDFSLIEVNPLVVTKESKLLCLDGKINIDDSALFRHPKLLAMRDDSQENANEKIARDWELSYIALDGNIGCMVNGAGLAMATMDIVKLYGGDPANFLDVGGGATKERVTAAFKIILSDKKVKGILVNIFGGIVKCDLIADGIIAAVKEVHVQVPVVVRLAGTNAKAGADKLEGCGLNIIAAKDLSDAAHKVVKAVGAA
jgi:succinyl-CoA synthetase beta subunit